MKFAIGMRNIKTALAVFICLLISQTFHLEYPFYAVIATIIAMENSVTNSYTVGKNRVMGTIVGAICGFLFALIDPYSAVFSALGIIVVIYVCNLLKWNKAVSIASIVFLAIMLNLRPGESPLFYGMNRMLDTLIGISVAVIVNYLVFPPKHERQMEHRRKILRRHLTRLAHQLLRQGGGVHISSLKQDMSELEKVYETYTSEFHLNKKKQTMMEHLEEEIDIYHNTYSHMRQLRLLTDEPSLEATAKPDVQFTSSRPLTSHGEDLLMIYRYHVRCILQELQHLGLMLPRKIAPPLNLHPEASKSEQVEANKPEG
jgi:uncharacterized membrane protein YgaE (UPF0421/DUF939 family)